MNDQVPAGVGRLSAEFRAPAVEAAFRRRSHGTNLSRARIFAALVVAAAVPYLVATYFRFGPDPAFEVLLACRLVIAAIGLLLLVAAFRRPSYVNLDRMVCALAFAILLQALLLAALSAPVSLIIDVQFVLVLIFIYVLGPTRFLFKAVLCLLASAAFLAETFWLYDVEPGAAVGLVSWVLGANILGLYASHHAESLRRRDYASQERLRQANAALRMSNRNLREAHQGAERANRVKSVFLANVSHELRTPLNAINGFSEAIQQELFGPLGNLRYKEYAEGIHKSGLSLLDLINHILEMAHVEAGNVEMQRASHRLCDLVAAAIRSLEDEARLGGIELGTEIPDDLPPVWTDAQLLGRVIVLLLSAAIRRSRAGSRITASATAGAGGSLFLRIAEPGRVLPRAEAQAATRLFARPDPHRAGAEDTDLSMPLAESLVIILGGRIRLEATPGQGSTILVRLPAGDWRARDPVRSPAA